MANIEEILTRHLENVKAKIASQMDSLGRNASGRSVASLVVEVNGAVGILWGSKSFLPMEKGRRPGPVPCNFVAIIKQWIIDKGLTVTPIPTKRKSRISPHERGLNSFAGAVAYKIMKEGTKLYRDQGYNEIYTQAVNEELEALNQELVLFHAKSIAQINEDIL